MSRCKAMIVDPNRLFREGLEKLLRSSKITVLATAKRLSELNLELAPEKPDLIVFGFDRDMNAEEQLRYLANARTESPQPRVVLLIHSTGGELLLKAAAAGLDAVLFRDISSVVLQRSLELVMLGQQVFPALALGHRPEAASHPNGAILPAGEQIKAVHFPIETSPASSAADMNTSDAFFSRKLGYARMPLSNREDQILQRLIAGAPNKVIARDLGITEGTVKIHVKSLCRKLGVINRTQAAIWGQKQ